MFIGFNEYLKGTLTASGRILIMNRSVLFRIFKFLLVVFLFLLILEFGSRGLLSIKLIDNLVRKNKCDVVWRWEWLERHRHGAGIWYHFDKYDPVKGWVALPNITGMPCFNKKVFNSNSRGSEGRSSMRTPRTRIKCAYCFWGTRIHLGIMLVIMRRIRFICSRCCQIRK